MKRFLFFAVLVMCAVQPSGGSAGAQESDVPASTGLFTLAEEAPIVERGDSRAWDFVYTDPGAVLFHDGQFHMFRNGFNGWPSSVQIGYLVSDDGVNWTEPQEEPVLRTLDVPYAEVAALASSALVEDDGTWVLYFYTWNTRSGANGSSAIGRATADNPLGPWTVDEQPLLLANEAGTWDVGGVVAPSVIKTDDGYVMYYSGYDASNQQRIGRATSSDGVTWVRDADPVLEASESWETFVHQPRVVLTPDGWVMLYRSMLFPPPPGVGNMRLNIATSTDGVTWIRAEQNPVFAAPDVSDASFFWFTALAYAEGTYYLYVEITPPDSPRNTDIYALTYTGSLPPE